PIVLSWQCNRRHACQDSVSSEDQVPKRFLFVCGVPRSGTTALAQLLNYHPRIGIGIERFRSIAIGSRGDEFRLTLYRKERFFKFRDGDGARDVFEKYS